MPNLRSNLELAAESPLRIFEATLDEIAAVAAFFDHSLKLRPRLGGFLDWGKLGVDKRFIQQFLSSNDIVEEHIYRSLHIYSYASFERFSREVLESFVTTIPQLINAYDKVPEYLQIEHTFRTGLALQTIKRQAATSKFDYLALSKNLASCVPGSTAVVLNASSISFAHSTLDAAAFADFFSRLGVELDWDNFGKDPEMQSFFGTRKTRDCANAIVKKLDDIAKQRNSIAHDGGTGITITYTDINRLLEFHRALGPLTIRQVSTAFELECDRI